jgi:GT2 family glycosyltransferase
VANVILTINKAKNLGMNSQKPRPDVSIILTSWNVCNLLRDCLRSVYEKTHRIAYEIIVLDDASTDGTADMVSEEFPEVKLIVVQRNLGFAGANNRAVELASGKYVLLLNSDTLILNNAIKALADFLDAHPEVGVCGGWLKNKDLTSQVSFGHFPSLYQAVVDAFFLNDLFPNAHLPNRATRPDGSISEPIEVDYVSGAVLLIRRKLIDQLGLFDQRFEAYCEEVDLCYRVKKEGKRSVYFVPDAKIIHLGGASYGQLQKRKIQIHYSSYNKFLRKYHGIAYAFCTRVLYAWHYVVKMVVRVLRYILSSREKRQEKKSQLLDAWFIVRYSLVPNEEAPGR